MQILENLQLLYCLNEKGEEKINEVLKTISKDPLYIKGSYEQLTQEFKEQEKESIDEHNKELEYQKEQLEEQYANDWHVIREQQLPFDKMNVIEAIFSLSNSLIVGRLNVFNLGVIEGKREERARRKKIKLK